MMREMKDSEIEWIGMIPKEWEVKKVKHCFIRKNEKAEQENPVILSLARSGVKIRDISTGEGQIAESYYNYNPVSIGDLLLNPMDLYSGANCSVSKVEGVISPAYINLLVQNGNNASYYDYYFKTQYWSMALFAHGKGVSYDNRWTLSAETLFNYFVPVPPIEVQRKIAFFLDEKIGKIDEIIIKTKKSIDEYKKYKQAVITEIITKGINANVSLVDSEVEYLGMIPKHWKIVPLNVLFRFIGGYAYKSDKFCEETDNQVIRIGNVKNDYFILDDKQVFIDEDYAHESEKCKIMKDDILFTMTGTKGKKDYFYTLLVKAEHVQNRNLFINQRVGCFRSISNKVCMSYYNYLLKYEPLLEYVFLFETGTANQGNLGIESISTLKLLLPPLKEQEEIVESLNTKCAEIDALIAKKEAFVEEMETYKKSLIYEYVTGKKEVL